MTTDSRAHLDTDTVAAYADGRLAPSECGRIEAHLAGCAACRDEVVSVRQLLASYQPRRRLLAPIPLAAAAVLVAAIGLSMAQRLIREPSPAPLRRPAAGAMSGVAVVTPATGTVVEGSGPTEFIWRTGGSPGGTFRLTLMDESGVTVWSIETGDTVAALPAGISLKAGASYFWYVDALAADGRSMTSGAQRFTVR
ncbi:MAG TPA: zf-HC2 domain-containing protein [Gemmatimonadales bacterium]